MLYMLSYKRDLCKLQRDKERTKRGYGTLIVTAEKENRHHDEIARLISEELFEIEVLDDKIIEIQTRFFTSQAETYLVPIPEFKTGDGRWEKSGITGRWRWSQETISNVKTAIRKE